MINDCAKNKQPIVVANSFIREKCIWRCGDIDIVVRSEQITVTEKNANRF